MHSRECRVSYDPRLCRLCRWRVVMHWGLASKMVLGSMFTFELTFRQDDSDILF